MMRTYDQLAAVVAQEGVTDCFALLGDANMAFATRLAGAGCRMIYVRHEHCAVAAAMAYARKTGGVGVATVTCGPGLTQLTTALPAAVRASLPLVVIAGEAPLKAAWYNQAIDQAPLVRGCGAAYHSLHVPARMPVAVRDAFAQAAQERRPVVLGIPFDLQEEAWTGPADLPTPSADLAPAPQAITPDPSALAVVAAAIKGAQRVVVLAGLGAVHATDECRALAAKVDGLLATTLPARGLFHDDPFSIGIAGGFASDTARACLGQADLILAIGCSLTKHTTDGNTLWPQAQVVHLDRAPRYRSQGQTVAQLQLTADAKAGLTALLSALPSRPSEWRTADLAAQIAMTPADSATFPTQPGLHDPREAVEALDAAIPSVWELVNSSGHCSYFFAQMPRRSFAKFLTIREFGAIGNGISFAMGVAVARPETPVVLFDGDGSLLMHVQELETILRHRLKILIVVFNDGAYGSEIHKLRADGLAEDGAVFGRTDLAAIARGFGADAERLDDLAALPQAVERFANSDRAMLIDVPISDKVVSPVIRRSHLKMAIS